MTFAVIEAIPPLPAIADDEEVDGEEEAEAFGL